MILIFRKTEELSVYMKKETFILPTFHKNITLQCFKTTEHDMTCMKRIINSAHDLLINSFDL